MTLPRTGMAWLAALDGSATTGPNRAAFRRRGSAIHDFWGSPICRVRYNSFALHCVVRAMVARACACARVCVHKHYTLVRMRAPHLERDEEGADGSGPV
jgi:hypothetical protein